MFSSRALVEFHAATKGLKVQPWYFLVKRSFTVRWKLLTQKVPKDFKTDLASIPQIMQSLIPLVGNHLQAAIVHDMNYRHGLIPKGDADDMFLDMMKYLGVPWWKRYMMYQAVNLFGGSSYKEVA
jgi:hypothetical protein